MKTFGFLLVDNTRCDVEASTAQSGFNKLNSIPFIRHQGLIHDIAQTVSGIVTNHSKIAQYQEYDNNGLASVYDWQFLTL